jgi:hypothetical protein
MYDFFYRYTWCCTRAVIIAAYAVEKLASIVLTCSLHANIIKRPHQDIPPKSASFTWTWTSVINHSVIVRRNQERMMPINGELRLGDCRLIHISCRHCNFNRIHRPHFVDRTPLRNVIQQRRAHRASAAVWYSNDRSGTNRWCSSSYWASDASNSSGDSYAFFLATDVDVINNGRYIHRRTSPLQTWNVYLIAYFVLWCSKFIDRHRNCQGASPRTVCSDNCIYGHMLSDEIHVSRMNYCTDISSPK